MIASQNSFVYISYDPSDESWKETIASRLRESDMRKCIMPLPTVQA